MDANLARDLTAAYNAYADRTNPRTLIGWSGDTIPNVPREMAATWLERKSWQNLHNADWITSDVGWQSWVTANPSAAADIGVPLIPHDATQALNDMLDEATAGGHDSDYISLGRELANHSPATVYARLWWEMNMRPTPADQIDRAKFKAAWARAVPLIRAGFGMTARPGQRLRIVFCPLTDGADWSEFWPGDDLVDVVALDAYATIWGTGTPTVAALLASVQGNLDKLAAFGRTHGKPLALGEWANWQTGSGTTPDSRGRGDFPEYIDAVFDWAQANPVAYLCYFNISDGTGLTLAQTPKSLARFQARAALLH